jgi:hypothetical protein
MVRFIRDFPDPTVINLKYLADLGVDYSWNVSWYTNNKAVVFDSGAMKAIIMPMSWPEEDKA